MVIAVTAGFWFVLQESVHILFSKYRPADVNVVVTDNKTFFAFTTIEGAPGTARPLSTLRFSNHFHLCF